MYKTVIVATAKNGMAREAMSFIKEMVEYVNSKHNLKVEAYMQVFGGTAGTFYLIGEYKDLDSLQAVQAKFMADEKYWTLLQKGATVADAPPTMALLRAI